MIRIFLRETPVLSLLCFYVTFSKKLIVKLEWQKIFLSLPIGGILPAFPKHCQNNPAPLLHPWAQNASSLSTFPTLSWLSWAAAAKKVGDELVAHDKTSSPLLPAPSLRAAWWSSCHSHLPVSHFLCPIPEVASAEIHWKITLGWKPMQIYVFGFFLFFFLLCELPLI